MITAIWSAPNVEKTYIYPKLNKDDRRLYMGLKEKKKTPIKPEKEDK